MKHEANILYTTNIVITYSDILDMQFLILFLYPHKFLIRTKLVTKNSTVKENTVTQKFFSQFLVFHHFHLIHRPILYYCKVEGHSQTAVSEPFQYFTCLCHTLQFVKRKT